MIQLRTQQQIAEMYFIWNQIGKMLKDAPELKPGEYNLSEREITFTLLPGTAVSRSTGQNGDGLEYKTATQRTYGFAMLHATIHYLNLYLAKFHLQKVAERLSLSLVKKIVKYALECEVTSEQAFNDLHPRLAKGIEDTKQKVRNNLGKIAYPTQRRAYGDMTVTSRKSKKNVA